MDPHPPQATDVTGGVAALVVAADDTVAAPALAEAGRDAAPWLALVPAGTSEEAVGAFVAAARSPDRATATVVLVARARPVTDAVKQVAPDGTIVGALDRTPLVRLGLPALVRRSTLAAALAAGQRADVTTLLAALAALGEVVVVDP